MNVIFRLGFLIIIFYVLVSCGLTSPLPQVKSYELHTFSEHSVEVAINLVIDETNQSTLVATYAPIDPTLHLYGKDMPMTGIDGAGRPTRLELVAGPVESGGELKANVRPTDRYFKGFEQPFPLYPDGPVTLKLPIKLLAINAEAYKLHLSVTYMACSDDGGCKPPVTDKQIAVVLPEAVWSD